MGNFLKKALNINGINSLINEISLLKQEGISSFSDIKTFLAERKFLYKNEEELPDQIRLDICNLCQLNCEACWVKESQKFTEKEAKLYVPFETFKNFADKHPFIRKIEVSNSGEIFLNPDLEDIIKYAYEKNITLSANNGVNLNNLSEETALALVKNKFERLVIYLDGASSETYSIYRKGGDFDTVINNIKMINKFKKKYNSIYPMLEGKFILFGHNEHEINAARDLAKKLNMNIQFCINSTPDYSPLKDKEKTYLIAGIEQNSSVEYYAEKYKEGKSDWFFCKDLYTNPQINYNGDLLGCCMNANKSFETNVFEVGLLKALNNKKVLHTKLMLSNALNGFKDDVPCRYCHIYDFLRKNNFPLKFI